MKAGDIYVGISESEIFGQSMHSCQIFIEPYPDPQWPEDNWRAYFGLWKDKALFVMEGSGMIMFSPSRPDFIFSGRNLSEYTGIGKIKDEADIKNIIEASRD